VKFLMRFAVPGFLFVFAALGISWSAAQTKTTAPKSGSPASATAPAKESQTGSTEKNEPVPPAAPGAIFPAVVAKVNGKPILGRDLETLVHRELAPIGNPEWKNLREDYRGQLTLSAINTLINSELVYQKAIASGTKVTDAQVQAEMEKIAKNFNSDAEMNAALADQLMDREMLEKDLRRQLVISQYLTDSIMSKISVTPEEVTKYYTTHPNEFQHAETVRTSHILIPAGETAEQNALARQRAEGILARAQKGEDFAKLAKEYSVDASASRGGDIGFNTRESLTPEYGDVAFSLPVSGIKMIKSSYGYHIIKVTDKRKEGLSTLEEIKEQLTAFLKDQKAQVEQTKLINQLRDQGNIEILIPAGTPLKP
jgi:parvulin-like peptidyl-prolyl isomerase